MAVRIQAINAYRPRIVQGQAIGEEQYTESLTRRSTLSVGVIKNVKESEMEELVNLLQQGRPVRTGNATYTLSITLEGRYEVHVKLDKRIAQELNAPGAFQGQIVNAESIGKTSDELVERWNKEHPDDPIEYGDGR